MRLACAVILVAAALAGDAPFPAGTSSHELHGLRCSIVMPDTFDAEEERSLMVILHGAGGTETGMASALAHLAEQDFVVLAPKAAAATWTPSDLEAVRAITKDLVESLNIGEERLHAAGFSNGGWNLAPVAFDEELRFQTACWVAAGYSGGSPPKKAKGYMGAIALAGSEDANRDSAAATPGALEGKVRVAEFVEQPGLGHEWPRELMDYYAWWLGVQEGRFTPGVSMSFDWLENEPAVRAAVAEQGIGGFVYWYSADDADDENAKAFQNELMQDAEVRFFGRQLASAKRNRSSDEDAFAALKLEETPALVVFDAKGKVKKTLQGKIKRKSLIGALRSVAKVKRLPR